MSLIELPGTTQGYEAGRGAGDFAGKIADAAADFACGLYKNYPGAVIGNPIDGALRGLYDSLCKNRSPGLPPAPTPQLNAGQCKCVFYDVSYTQVSSSGSQQTTGTVLGPIKGVRRVYDATFPGLYTVVLTASECANGEPTGTLDIPIGAGSDDGTSYVNIDGIVRSDGQPDNCGSSDPAYPLDTYNPPPGWNSGTGSVTYNDGTDFSFPLVYAPITPTLSLNPKINVTVNANIKLQFDLGGVKIDLGNGNESPSLPRDRFNDPSDDFDRIGRAIDDLGDKIDNLPGGGGEGGSPTPCEPPQATPPEDDPKLEPKPKTEDDPKEESGVEKLRWVKIVLTSFPDKMHYGNGAPNCYFAGWIEFKSKGACFPREQINFQTSLFLAPPGADGYAYTLTNGARGYAIVFKEKDNP